jgi:hypothetical protein
MQREQRNNQKTVNRTLVLNVVVVVRMLAP